MELLILDQNLIPILNLDIFESIIWTDRYYGYGDFEIYTSPTETFLNLLVKDNFIISKDSDKVMIIEDRKIATNADKKNTLTITGRSLESILDRRIVWGQAILSGNFQTGIKNLLNANIISPSDPDRKISNFIFETSTDPKITALTIDAQFTGDNLYDAIYALCLSNSIGFKVTLNSSGKFVFKLYSGVDRSYNQSLIPYVVFSPRFENLINANYTETNSSFKDVTLVAGEGEGTDRRTAEISRVGAGVGIFRRELFTDARDISSTIDGGTLSVADYNSQLSQRGIENLSASDKVVAFDGSAEITRLFKYGLDFFIGDIVELENEYGIEVASRVIELIRSQSVTDMTVYPTFSAI